jgi:hypothetical protein
VLLSRECVDLGRQCHGPRRELQQLLIPPLSAWIVSERSDRVGDAGRAGRNQWLRVRTRSNTGGRIASTRVKAVSPGTSSRLHRSAETLDRSRRSAFDVREDEPMGEAIQAPVRAPYVPSEGDRYVRVPGTLRAAPSFLNVSVRSDSFWPRGPTLDVRHAIPSRPPGREAGPRRRIAPRYWFVGSGPQQS